MGRGGGGGFSAAEVILGVSGRRERVETGGGDRERRGRRSLFYFCGDSKTLFLNSEHVLEGNTVDGLCRAVATHKSLGRTRNA